MTGGPPFNAPLTYCSRLAPKWVLDASVESAKGAEGFGYSRVMALVNMALASMNAFLTYTSQKVQ